MKIIKDKDGKLINIGDWDYQIDENGKQHNPLPEGATEHHEEIVTGYDGGLYLKDDPRRISKI